MDFSVDFSISRSTTNREIDLVVHPFWRKTTRPMAHTLNDAERTAADLLYDVLMAGSKPDQFTRGTCSSDIFETFLCILGHEVAPSVMLAVVEYWRAKTSKWSG